MKRMYPKCPKCGIIGQIIEMDFRRCLNDECDEKYFTRYGPYDYEIRCIHDQICQKDWEGNTRVCVKHCDGSWNAYTKNQAELIKTLHETEHSSHIAEVIQI